VIAVGLGADGKAPAFALLNGNKRGDQVLWLWDLRTGERAAVLRGHAAYVFEAAFSPDGRTLATADDDGVVRLWDAVTGHARGELRGHPDGTSHELAFRPDGKALALSTYDGDVSLWAAQE
jgi:WD40 repeat protein